MEKERVTAGMTPVFDISEKRTNGLSLRTRWMDVPCKETDHRKDRTERDPLLSRR